MARCIAIFILLSVMSAFVLPLSIFFIAGEKNTPEDNLKREKSSQEISVFFPEEKRVEKMPLEEYLYGVVSAEMPAEFESEALKAQAVAARSYAIYRTKNQSADHPRAEVCTDYTHCKAYKTKEAAQTQWGDMAQLYTKKIEDAVNSTKSEIITYKGEVALAVFHSQSGGGRTESSADVWGGEVPYLVSVESHGEENAPNFYSSATVPFNEFRKKIIAENPNAKINSAEDIGESITSEGGSVKSIIIGGESFKGKDIRTMFSLRSSCFRISADNENVRFEVTGYGHGVGMSQYGANTMAKEGFTYKEILAHYYSGTEIDAV